MAKSKSFETELKKLQEIVAKLENGTESLEDSLKFSFYKKGSRKAAMREFAETKKCRRQVLLDALGAEQAVCSGCDLCNSRIEKSNEYRRKKIKY